ncbi:hypothetical protein G9F31_00920 [Acinetobacter sp. 187]|uniref:hypothetical protein n=1 Tax=Acinetobacter lanii TaxID=2715163 RepID=UPI00140985F1|nr:hypothetical protein [Acinetobacter lanii]NHC02346.1 hypothetical protein [Acinetobacter lanii]
MNAVAEKFEQFEWLTKGITAKSPQFGDEGHSTGAKPLDYQDRLGAIGKMETQLEKSVTSVIIYGEQSKGDFEFIQNHLARIMIVNAGADGKKNPKTIDLEVMASKVAWGVMMFSFFPEMERKFTAYGRLCYMGLEKHMSEDAYRMSWKRYENLMVLALESAIDSAAKVVEKYKKDTFKEC